jgi:hypothetical protein
VPVTDPAVARSACRSRYGGGASSTRSMAVEHDSRHIAKVVRSADAQAWRFGSSGTVVRNGAWPQLAGNFELVDFERLNFDGLGAELADDGLGDNEAPDG